MPAAQKLLIDLFMTWAAVSGGKRCRNHKSVVFLLLLPGSRLMALQAIYSPSGVQAHLVLMHDGILRTGVAFSAFARGAHEFRAGLFGLNLRARPVYEER
jgi:hypothetical protein